MGGEYYLKNIKWQACVENVWSIHHWLNLPNTRAKHHTGTQHAKAKGLSAADKLTGRGPGNITQAENSINEGPTTTTKVGHQVPSCFVVPILYKFT